MLRWTLAMVVLFTLCGCGSDQALNEPGEKVAAGGAGARAPLNTPVPAPSSRKETAALPAEVDPSKVKADGEPITDPEDLPGKDPALELAVEVGLHETEPPPVPLEKVVIELDEKGRIVGPIPDTVPDVPHLFDADNFICPGNSVIQGARPPKGRELGCRVGGMLVGPFLEWYDNGQRRVEKRYVDGVKQGPVRQWYRDGSLKAIRYFERSRPDGRYARWHVNSRIAEKGEYELGKEVGPWTAWYPNGKKESEGMYVSGWKEGPWIYWYPNGQKKKEGRYVRSQKTGVWTFWHQNGQLEKEGEFLNDYPAHRLRIYDEDGTPLQ